MNFDYDEVTWLFYIHGIYVKKILKSETATSVNN